jgi:hypothetical protein
VENTAQASFCWREGAFARWVSAHSPLLNHAESPETFISGGVRGILELCVLKRVEEVVGVPIQELFDVAIGTSTGKLDDLVDIALSKGLTYPKAASSYSVSSSDNGASRQQCKNLSG